MNSIKNAVFFFVFLSIVSCDYTLKIKDGKTAFDRKQFATAAPMLEKEFAAAKTRAERGKLAFLAAQAYEKMGQTDRADQWFKTAADNQYGPDALRAVAFGLKKQEKYDEAAAAFKELGIEIGSPYEYRKEITACAVAKGWLGEAARSGISVESAAFNSASNDFSPAFFQDGKIVFSSDRASGKSAEKYRWTGQSFMDLYVAEPIASAAQLFDNQLNTSANEGSAVFNSTFSEVYFVRSVAVQKGGDAYDKIFMSQRDDAGWSPAEPLAFQKEKVNYLSPALAADGQTLFFSSNDPDGLGGGFDLFFSQKKDGDWAAPQCLPRNLNSAGNEIFPTFDGDTLYFSSDGLAGMGGLDIFKTYRLSGTTAWSPPQNLKSPLNSGADDFGLVFNKNFKKEKNLLGEGFFTSNRAGGRGGDDVYFFQKKTPPPAPPKPPDTTSTTHKPLIFKLLLEGYVVEKIFKNADDPNSSVLGRKPLAGSQVVVSFGKNQRKTFTVGDDGLFKMELEEGMDYQFSASKTGFLANSTTFSTKNIARDPAHPTQTFEVEIVLDKIFRDKEIVLENIYYDYDKAEIRPDAEPTLNRLAEILKQNPTIKIQLGSHTDCRGNDNYNESLSQRRAESAVNYLISKGLAPERLLAKGFGESAPAVLCNCPRCTEEEHQANRRTTFKVLE